MSPGQNTASDKRNVKSTALEAIPAATGSLGHGLPIAAGLAYAHKYIHQTERRVACLVSDGECNSGSLWEAALFAGHHRLDNLTVIVDAAALMTLPARAGETPKTAKHPATPSFAPIVVAAVMRSSSQRTRTLDRSSDRRPSSQKDPWRGVIYPRATVRARWQ